MLLLETLIEGEHILKASDELRASYVTIEGRLVEWVGFSYLKQDLRETELACKKSNRIFRPCATSELLDIGMPPEGPTDASGLV